MTEDDAFEWKGRTRVAEIAVQIGPHEARVSWRRIPPIMPQLLVPAAAMGMGVGGAALGTAAAPVVGASMALLLTVGGASVGFVGTLAAYARWYMRLGVGAAIELDASGLRVRGPGVRAHVAIEEVLHCTARSAFDVDGREWRLVFGTATAELPTVIAFVDAGTGELVADRLDHLVRRLRARGGYR